MTELLLATCATTKPNKNKIGSLIQQNIDWEHLLKLAGSHGLMPLLYLSLKDENIPENILEQLKSSYYANLVHNMMIDAEQKKVFKLLNDNDIEFIPLKGTTLAEYAYRNIALRATSDIDILVKKEDVFRTRDLLYSDGFKETGAYSEDYYLKELYHLSVTKIESNRRCATVEIHWNIIPPKIFNLDPAILWEGANLKSLSLENLIIFELLTFYYEPIVSLKYLVDISETIRNHYEEIDWEKLKKLLISLKLAPFYLLIEKLLFELFDIPPKHILHFKDISILRRLIINKFPTQYLIRKEKSHMVYLARILLVRNFKELLLNVGYFFLPSEDKLTSDMTKNGKISNYINNFKRVIRSAFR